MRTITICKWYCYILQSYNFEDFVDGCSSKHTTPIFCQDNRNVPFEYKHGHNIKRTIETVLHVVISYFSFAIRKNYRL